MSKTVLATVVLPIDELGRVCLAPKKQNIHTQSHELKGSKKWNGYGGKQEGDETILATAIREFEQESGARGKEEDLELAACISFFWPGNETTLPDMIVYFFFLSAYEGSLKEGTEMGTPEFFFPDEIPYAEMMPADQLFFPRMLMGLKFVWHVHLGKKTKDGNIYFEDKRTLPTLCS